MSPPEGDGAGEGPRKMHVWRTSHGHGTEQMERGVVVIGQLDPDTAEITELFEVRTAYQYKGAHADAERFAKWLKEAMDREGWDGR